MTNRIIIYLSIICIAGFAACTKIVDDRINLNEKFYVLNSIITPDSNFSCYITKTKGVLDNPNTPFEAISNASVLMYEEGVLIDTLLFKANNYYQAKSKPSAGKSYTIKVFMDNKLELEAQTTIPKVAGTLDSIVYIKNYFYSVQWEQMLRGMKIYMFDPSEINYYEYGMYKQVNQINWPDSLTEPHLFQYLEIMDKYLQGEGYTNKIYFHTLTYSDLLFENNHVKIEVGGGLTFTSYGSGIKVDSSIAYLRTVSRDYYLFKKSWDLQNHQKAQQTGTNANIENQLFPVELTDLYSNVKGGAGIFGAYLIDRKAIIKRDFE